MRAVAAFGFLAAAYLAHAQAAGQGLVARLIDPSSLAAALDDGWRRPEFEVYRWAAIPGFVLLDTRDYETQQRMFHRLAFFVEKTGYVGRIVDYDEIAELHGYLAHNYYSEDLSRFFNLAERKGIPLLAGEQQLLAVLLANGVLVRRPDRYEPRPGGVLAISREAGPELRRLHTLHELTHALFYSNPDYAARCRRAWSSLQPELQRYYRLFLSWRGYNTSDSYLLVNEFQAWTLHQSERGVEKYFRDFARSQLQKNPAQNGTAYRAIVDMEGEPFLDVHRALRAAMTSAAPGIASALDALR